jgi:hypothetical protein
MFKKSFTSVYFSANKLYILQLDGRRKKVKNFGSAELPRGLIKNYRVQDKPTLANILKKIWKSNSRLREKSLGIVIPEFSTFTKLFSLPKLPFSELNEAVGWQAQESLPTSANDMVMDWMIVGQNKKGYEVLTVAMETSILEGFVEAAETAGLFPLAVEIPSLCLVRVSDSVKSLGRLIIYKNSGESILVVAAGAKIFGTSVLHTNDQNVIISTASKITSHYKKDVKIEKILIGGTGVDGKLIQQLESVLKRDVEWIRPKIKGLSEAQIQEYLIPICMQLDDLDEPSDQYSLNLLPLALVTKYKRARLALQIWSLTLTITLVVWISFFISIGSYLFIAQQIDALKARSTSKVQMTQQNKKIAEEVKYINDVAERVLKIKSISASPQKVLNDIKDASPSGIFIREYKLDLDRGIIEVTGRASTRQVLLEFKKNLEKNPDITSVEIPISNFEVEKDLRFNLNFVYLPVRKLGDKKQVK